jgi:TPR repeat protein
MDGAERLLRDGMLENPKNCELLYELGKLYYDGRHQAAHARNIWELAVFRWQEQERPKPTPDTYMLWLMADHLGALEEDQHNYERALQWYQIARNVAHTPAELQRKIDDLKARMNAESPAPTNNPHF